MLHPRHTIREHVGILIKTENKKEKMKRFIVYTIIAIAAIPVIYAQEEDEKYRRSSIYSLCISHENTTYAKEISDVFVNMPVPDKFNNHDLNIKILTSADKKEDNETITSFLNNNNVARRLVGYWFQRNPATGECSLDLISERGLYDADYFDVELSRQSIRGEAMLKDAGEDLIGNTFVLVNDIRYVDKQKTAAVASGILRGIGAIAGAFFGSNITDMANNVSDIVENIRGFRVIVTSYLYQLEWNDTVAAKFYNDYYIAPGAANEQKRQAFTNDNSTFKLRYVGVKRIDSGQTSYAGVFEPVDMIRKVCMRAIDKSVVELQRTYDEFKVKTPIFSVSPNITAKIGMKEGMTEESRYEVLERIKNQDGTISYKRVGVIAPITGQIWDNRYMATEERSSGSELTCTTFRKVSGGTFYPGMLIREIRIK